MWFVLQMCQHSLYARYTHYLCPLDRSQILRFGEPLQTVHVAAPQHEQETGRRKSRRLWFKPPLKNLVSDSMTTLTVFEIRLSQLLIKHKRSQDKLSCKKCLWLAAEKIFPRGIPPGLPCLQSFPESLPLATSRPEDTNPHGLFFWSSTATPGVPAMAVSPCPLHSTDWGDMLLLRRKTLYFIQLAISFIKLGQQYWQHHTRLNRLGLFIIVFSHPGFTAATICQEE